jgi:hypothetical protein
MEWNGKPVQSVRKGCEGGGASGERAASGATLVREIMAVIHAYDAREATTDVVQHSLDDLKVDADARHSLGS